ncbi:hypothetical protein LTR84_005847 [Exophiala bonariae]|uniref:C2H2-type domain-containing protein n=1 Tax=Exophiala bonariae TaxID=1690606 RepID=A0AAV9N2X7_9EURO|nr:hypothetical protein LTR84_005847 [Exophiala bonariae]
MEGEYPQLALTTYLDHAGTTLYPQSAIRSFAKDMTENLYGNPHSASPSSSLSTAVIEEVRNEVLERFNASAEQYDLVFVANATAAIKMVAQAFQDQIGGFWYGYHKDAHTSLVGVRELAQNGHRCFRSDEEVDSWIEGRSLPPGHLGLFGFPAQSNMTGYRPPLTWGSRVRRACGPNSARFYTLLDAASYLTTGNLNLSDPSTAPDFVALSFYKIFGFPDLGALIVRREAAPVLLSRKYFGGGTVEMVLAVDDPWHQSHRKRPHEALEDGTLPFHNILALKHSLRAHKILYPSPVQVSNHAAILSRYAYTTLESFRHENGTKVITIYKDPNGQYGDSLNQGPIISMNLHDLHGNVVGKTRVEALACACGFQLRTGSLCNPGGIATRLGLRPWEMKRNHSHGMRCGDELDFLGGKPTGVLRISLGAMTTKSDIDQFLEFVDFFFVCHGNDQIVNMHTSDSNIDHAGSVIQPIKGCEPLAVADEEFESYMPWHEDWLIVNPISRKEIFGHETELRRLVIDIQPVEGKMIVVRPHEQHPVEDLQRSLVVDLWNDNLNSSQTQVTVCGVPSDNDANELSSFFTSVLGIPATLARRNNREVLALIEKKYICVVWGCGRVCRTAADLDHHYQSHAHDFSRRKTQGTSSGHTSISSPKLEAQSKLKSKISWITEDLNQTLKQTKLSFQKKTSRWKPGRKKKSRSSNNI